jgi:hypothetical protein
MAVRTAAVDRWVCRFPHRQFLSPIRSRPPDILAPSAKDTKCNRSLIWISQADLGSNKMVGNVGTGPSPDRFMWQIVMTVLSLDSQGGGHQFKDRSSRGIMKATILTLLTMIGLVAASSSASANPYANPFGQVPGHQGMFFRKAPVPAFQAAPWYLYWPYDAHFQTPAPLSGPYYAPPQGGFMANPYFPAPIR